VKLLLDQNLSPQLVSRLSMLEAEVEHVRNLGLATAADSVIWTEAARTGYTIVSKDSDFHQRSLLFGAHRRWFGFAAAIVRPPRSLHCS